MNVTSSDNVIICQRTAYSPSISYPSYNSCDLSHRFQSCSVCLIPIPIAISNIAIPIYCMYQPPELERAGFLYMLFGCIRGVRRTAVSRDLDNYSYNMTRFYYLAAYWLCVPVLYSSLYYTVREDEVFVSALRFFTSDTDTPYINMMGWLGESLDFPKCPLLPAANNGGGGVGRISSPNNGKSQKQVQEVKKSSRRPQ